jgi:hypothetical protein
MKETSQSSLADVRKIGKVGKYSYCVTLPREIIRALRWRQRQRVVVSLEGDAIVIRDWKDQTR